MVIAGFADLLLTDPDYDIHYAMYCGIVNGPGLPKSMACILPGAYGFILIFCHQDCSAVQDFFINWWLQSIFKLFGQCPGLMGQKSCARNLSTGSGRYQRKPSFSDTPERREMISP